MKKMLAGPAGGKPNFAHGYLEHRKTFLICESLTNCKPIQIQIKFEHRMTSIRKIKSNHTSIQKKIMQQH
jgi:hypothetical protein